MSNLYNRKRRKASLFLIFLLFITIMPQNPVQGAETETVISIDSGSGEITALDSTVQSQNTTGFVYGSGKNNTAKVTDLYIKKEWTFTISLNDFTKAIEAVRLTRTNDGKSITIGKSNIKVVSDKDNEKEINVNITGENAINFSTEDYTGSYNIEVKCEGEETWIPIIAKSQYSSKDITVMGQNFRSDIEQITLTNVKNGAWIITVPREAVTYKSETELTLRLEDRDVEKISEGLNTSDIEMAIDYESEYIFDKDLNYWKFQLEGENFNQGVEKIILRPVGGSALSLPVEEQDIIIENNDISVNSNTGLSAELEQDDLNKLKEYNHSGDYKIIIAYSPGSGLREYTSSMNLKVLYNYGLKLSETVVIKDNLKIDNKSYLEDSINFTLLSKSTPKVLEIYPKSTGGYPWISENDLSHSILTNRSFLKVTFEDIDGKLEFNPFEDAKGQGEEEFSSGIGFLLGSSVRAVGSNTEYLDTEFLNMCKDNKEYFNSYLFIKDRANKKAYLYIPVKPLSPQGNYIVSIPAKVLMNDASENGQIDSSKRYSKEIYWEFTTMASPSVSDKGILDQTVIEDYDSGTYIKIFGDFFYSSSLEVFFNDEEAYDVEVKQDSGGNTYLEVYLPRGRRKLEPGLYNIIVQNDDEHTTITYGTLSVLEEGEHIPTEEYKIKNEDTKGDVLSEIHVSNDTIYLKPRYRDNYRVELDLDELMGEEVWTRNISYAGDTRDSIGELATKSKYGDISFYDLTLDRNRDTREINLRIGRAAPVAVQTLQVKLRNKIAKSNFIEVSAENCTWDEIYLSIPYENSSGDNLALYRYDEVSRTWNRENSYVDQVNQKVNGVTEKEGIFVIIENHL